MALCSLCSHTNWTILERSVGERGYANLPSNPAVYSWPPQSSGGFIDTKYHVPSSFSCPGGAGIGRFLWKTGNTCLDVNNIGRDTETFKESELPWTKNICAPGNPPETFISCFDFKIEGSSSPSPLPASTTPQPTQAPQPTPAPQPTLAPTPPIGPIPCHALCGRTSTSSCSIHDSDQQACESSYRVEGSLLISCLWTDCGCVADGDNLLECPNLHESCASTTPSPPAPTPERCDEFCQHENLSQRFLNWTRSASDPSYCFYYKHHMDLCRTSYVRQSGLTIPCMWLNDDCVADQSGAVNCIDFVCPQ